MSSSKWHAWFASHCPGRCLSTWPTIAVSCPTALSALCSQLTFLLVWRCEHSTVMATVLLQPRNSPPVQLHNPDITYGLFRWQLKEHLFQETWTWRSVTSDMWHHRQTLTYLNATVHTHTHLTSLFLGLPRWAGTRKVKPMWILQKQETDSEWQWHQLAHMQVCTLLQTDNHTSTPPHCLLRAGCPSCHPTNRVKALKAIECYSNHIITRISIQTARLAFGGTGLCTYRVRGVDGSCAKHLTVESLRSFMLLTVILIIISFLSPTHSFIPGLKSLFCKSFPLQPLVFFFRTDYMIPPDFYCYFWA